jgi:outer membrane protein assembly factor BamB
MRWRYLVSFAVLLISLHVSSVAGDDWSQWRGNRRDGIWRETGLIDRFPGEQIELKWRVPISGGYSGPTVAQGRVYVTDRQVEPEQVERVLCFDTESGKPLWSHQYACPYRDVGYQTGPRAAVLVRDGRAYSLGTMGHLFCFDAATGVVLWNRDLYAEYDIRMPNWGISAAPLLVDDTLIVQAGGDQQACVVAVDCATGKQRWTALADDASYSAPIVMEQAGKRVVVVWTGDRVTGLDPASGKLWWDHEFKWERWPIGIADPVAHQDLLLVSEAHKGTLLLRCRQDKMAVEPVWHRRKENTSDGIAMHCLMSTPYIDGDHIYGADINGVLRCLRLDNGEQVWEDRSAVPEETWATIHLVRNGPRTWLFNERGELIIARLTPAGYDEISRAKLIEPTTGQLRRRGGVTWSHPAFANRHVFARNDRELVCADLSK